MSTWLTWGLILLPIVTFVVGRSVGRQQAARDRLAKSLDRIAREARAARSEGPADAAERARRSGL